MKMKNLLYKEFKLSIHPLAYLFMALMCLQFLTPGGPSFIGIIYLCVTYTFLFIGMNKTTTTNDLFYTCNLPISRSDVVKARIASTSFFQIVYTTISLVMASIEKFVIEANMSPDEVAEIKQLPFIGIEQGIVLIGAFLICYSVFDLIYLPWFYKNGKSIIGNMFVGMIGVAATGALVTYLPFVSANFVEMITIGSNNANYFLQCGLLLVSIAIWIGSKFLVCKMSAKRLIKLDF